MASVADAAAYVLEKHGAMTAMKLHKLLYYAQAWHLVWDEEPLFDERIEAWANGPIVPAIYQQHRGRFKLDSWDGDAANLAPNEAESVDVVLEDYGNMSAHDLSTLTHLEAPWRDARGDLPQGEPSTAEITTVAMFEYYDGLLDEAEV